MKKLLSILLIICSLLLSCVACNTNTETPLATTDTTAPSCDHTHTEEPAVTTTPASEQSSAERPTQTKEETATSAELPEKPTTPQSNATALKRGSFANNTYKNTTLNLTFQLPAGWVFYSDKELCSLSGLSLETFSDFITAAENNPAVYDMYAVNKENGTSVSLCYENLLYTTGSTLTANEYLEVIKAAVAGAGVSEIEDKGSADFCNRTYRTATITSGNGDVKNRQTYYLTAFENYMVTIIITTKSADAEADILKMFG